MQAEGVALVTGASRGIGRAVALELAAAGFDVVAAMRNPADGADLEAAGTGSIRSVRLDVDDPTTMEIPDELAVLVNNAGIERQYLPVESTPSDDWRSVFETNVFGLIELTSRAIPTLRANGGGVICNVTSSAVLSAIPFYSVYRASKAAVSAFSETLRLEVAPFGIRVVEVLPGPIQTDMLDRSERVPEASGIPGYEAMADAMFQGRMSIADQTTPVAVAAANIVGAILDDGAPLKQACDELATSLLAAWASAPLALVDPMGAAVPTEGASS